MFENNKHIANGEIGYTSSFISGPAHTGTFGANISLARDETYMAVGIVGDNTPYMTNGSVVILTGSGTTWSVQTKIQPSGGCERLFSRPAIDADGNTLVICGNDNCNGYGKAYVYTRSGSTWSLQTDLDASVDFTVSQPCISDDGNTIVVSKYSSDSSMRVYTRSGSTWSPQSTITQTGEWLGYSLALSPDGNKLVGGAVLYDGVQTNQGAVYVYTRSGSTWTQQQRIDTPTPITNGNFGSHVCLSSDTNTISVVEGDTTNSAIHLFGWNGSSYTHSATLTNALFDAQNYEHLAFNADGTMLVVGCGGTSPLISGHSSMLIYRKIGGTWHTEPYIITSARAGFGSNVECSADGRILYTSSSDQLHIVAETTI